jgi:hypothetical protein
VRVRRPYGQTHSKGRAVPIIDIRLKGPGRSVKRPGLIDSGAEKSALSSALATTLALPVVGQGTASGIGGIVKANEVSVDLEILVDDAVILSLDDCQVYAMPPSTSLSYVILGRDTIFDHFRVTFDERAKEFILESY